MTKTQNHQTIKQDDTTLLVDRTEVASILVKLQEKRGRAVSVGRIVHDLGPAKWAGLLPIEPGAHAQLAKDVVTLEQYGTVEVVVTDRTLATASLQLLLRRDRSVARFLQQLDDGPFAELDPIEQVR